MIEQWTFFTARSCCHIHHIVSVHKRNLSGICEKKDACFLDTDSTWFDSLHCSPHCDESLFYNCAHSLWFMGYMFLLFLILKPVQISLISAWFVKRYFDQLILVKLKKQHDSLHPRPHSAHWVRIFGHFLIVTNSTNYKLLEHAFWIFLVGLHLHTTACIHVHLLLQILLRYRSKKQIFYCNFCSEIFQFAGFDH